jgi:photosystem II stability/assembly factor-like uncharacterized protein
MARPLALLATLAFLGGSSPSVDTMELVSPSFGWALVGSRDIHVISRGRDRIVSPPLGIRFVEAVDFVDENRGWVAEYDCGHAAVFLYRTTNGGRSWTSLGHPGAHSCGFGPTYLSFVDATHGWLEPLNQRSGYLRRTIDGGRTWRTVTRNLPCVAGSIAFTSRTVGWIGRCSTGLFRTANGGRTWKKVFKPHSTSIVIDLPVAGVTASVGTGVVRFSTSTDGGLHWQQIATRKIYPCADTYVFHSFFPESVASARIWWVVDQGRVAITTDAGLHWSVHHTGGLPSQACAVRSVSAADARHAWAIAGNVLYATSSGGLSWRRIF